MSNQISLELSNLNEMVDKLVNVRESVRVLEAGCGSMSHINLKENYHLVGIDISEKQLERNSHLKEKILGDIQTYNLLDSSFDMIVCFWVLEHVSHPELAFKNFVKALKEGGLLVIGLPNVMSLKGLITKYTPHWFHIWIYRNIFNDKLAGINDRGPFPTFMKFSISPEGLKSLAKEYGLSVEYFSIYEDFRQENLRKQLHIENQAWKSLQWLVKKFSFGKIDLGLSEYIIVLKKPQYSL